MEKNLAERVADLKAAAHEHVRDVWFEDEAMLG